MRWIQARILFISVIFFLAACHSPEKTNKGVEVSDSDNSGKSLKEVIVYGSKTCPHCMVFIRKMDQEGISYTFKEVDNDDANFKEMYDKIKAINFQGYVNYPVIDVGGEILVAPDLDQFNKVYQP